MKKLTKLLSGLACLALATSLIACKTPEDPTGGEAPGGNKTTPEETPTTPTGNTVTVSGDLITFTANADAVANGADVKLCLKYNRSAEGADEAITISDCNIEVKYNKETVSVGKTLNFELDPYSSFDANYNYASAEIPAKQKEYKAFIDVAKNVKAGDVVTVELKSGVVSGNGLGKVELADVVIALIDKNKDAGGIENSYYFELCTKENEYQGLITKVNGKEFESGEGDPIEGSTDGDDGIVLVTLKDAINCEEEPDAANDVKWQEQDAVNGAVVCCWGTQTVADPRHSARIYKTALAGASVGDMLAFTVSGDDTCFQIDNQDWTAYNPIIYDKEGNDITDSSRKEEGSTQYTRNGLYFISLTEAMLSDGIEFHGAATISNVYYVIADAE